MRNLIIGITLITLFTGCTSQSDKKTINATPSFASSDKYEKGYQNKESVDPISRSEVVKFIIDDLNTDLTRKKKFLEAFPHLFNGLTPNDIKKITHFKKVLLKKWGETDIYNFELSENLPEVIDKKGILVVSKKRAQAAVFFLEHLRLVKLIESDTDYFIGGTHISKSKGYFYLYDFDGLDFQSSFNTLSNQYCKNGIPIYNNSMDCISYQPFELQFQNIDINKDGLLDLSFSGNLLSFCKELEFGYGRKDRKPISVSQLNITFLANKSNDKIGWVLSNNSPCNDLYK
ncbi:hypothetical protein [Chitinophaga nivalis]|uniref:Lipoprotein n=1 Tax=Chitinophaga nivalis TaxID=2991709 RepID=A0ABT3IMX8_9BACT|nr:hypothetical protein [Chitinophaga nivalis]MCW3465168.1 hypothetical protein [Chitinophaga nivalis]MCW3485140.1 hypothetical protein [Chitinophaga nivalis]